MDVFQIFILFYHSGSFEIASLIATRLNHSQLLYYGSLLKLNEVD